MIEIMVVKLGYIAKLGETQNENDGYMLALSEILPYELKITTPLKKYGVTERTHAHPNVIE